MASGIGADPAARRAAAMSSRGVPRGPAGRVDLVGVVQLDDLDRLVVRRGQRGEAHQQHRAEREVGRDEHADARRVGRAAARTGVEPVRRPAGGADDGVHAVPDAGQHVVERRRRARRSRRRRRRSGDGRRGRRRRRPARPSSRSPRGLDRRAHLDAHPAARHRSRRRPGRRSLTSPPSARPNGAVRVERADDGQRARPRRSSAASVAHVVRGHRARSAASALVESTYSPCTELGLARAGSSASRCPPCPGRARRAPGRCARASSSSPMPRSASPSSSARISRTTSSTLRRRAAGVQAEVAGVGVARRERVDRVGQAALLADLLEQPAAHAAAEHGVEHRHGVAPLVGGGQRRRCRA